MRSFTICNRFFRLQFPFRPDMSGCPYGLLFIWRPRETDRFYKPVECDWSVGFLWYAPWQWVMTWEPQDKRWQLPRWRGA